MTCLHCGGPIPAGSRRHKQYCRRKCRDAARFERQRTGTAQPPLWQHPALTSDNPVLQAAAVRAKELGEDHGWSPSTTRCTIDGLAELLDGCSPGQPVLLGEIRARSFRRASAPPDGRSAR
ncbi:hypothetical protein [Nocardiopsis gilva]|uniref:hypothetical protein n=1 Tax=Nocardiopsis gilva TaxID=280236 RepID=UPI001268422A|nr:hypothetical protein [Nocardiopsis gilva]